MSLSAASLLSFQSSAGITFQNASSGIHDEYTVAASLVENIYTWLRNAEIRIFVPGINPSGTVDVWSTEETSQGKLLNIVVSEDESLRIALEASLIASFRDEGPDGQGEPGLRIFCNQDITDSDILQWEQAVADVIANISSDADLGEITGDLETGYPFFLSKQSEWVEASTPPYAAAEAVTEIIDGGEMMFSGPVGMKTQMEINRDSMSSSEDAGLDFANAVNEATIGATVTSMFTNGTFTQAALEIATIE